MESKGRIKGISRNTVTMEIDWVGGLNDFTIDEDLKIVIKKWHNPRTLKANAYLWELIGKLEDTIGIPRVELYREFIRRSGQFYEIWVEPDNVERTLKAKTDIKPSGTGDFAERNLYGDANGLACITIYEGSSGYDQKEFSLLIADVIGECKEYGIETLTPAEIMAMGGLKC